MKKVKLISANRPDRDPPPAKRFGWPLGLNPSMDQHLQYTAPDLRHWSCLSPSDNSFWIRRDGEVCHVKFLHDEGYTYDLRAFDRLILLREPLKIFQGDTRR